MTATPLLLTLHERSGRRHRAAVEAGFLLGGSLLMAGLAQLALPLPFTPIPITGQTLGVLLVGAALGANRGAASMLLYLVQGAAGLPFFAGGRGGLAVVLGPSGGYLVGCVAAVWVVGRLAERGLDRRPGTAVAAFAAGEVVVYACGVPWLAGFVGADAALAAGFWPFLPGAALKAAIAAALVSGTWSVLARRP